ncbi:MAG: ATP-grasp domain-containing protein [Actinomycetota bacterium]|nr:ATP-grasp domain-containing protein [Actinomycetota bacterium]
MAAPRQLRRRGSAPGAVVIGGDYQGLAIVRSLGRRGIDVVVLDDEVSVSRCSRFTAAQVRVPDLRRQEAIAGALLALADRYDLHGWVLFPTREETVAAISRYREDLLARYRVPTPEWDVVKWAWDKRNTYQRAAELGLPVPRSWTLRSHEELEEIDGDPPFVIKPAIKEHFFYATKQKAWRADTRLELAARVREAIRLIDVGEVIVQELIPGSGQTQLAFCAFFKGGRAAARMTVKRLRQHPPEFGRSSTYVQTISDATLDEPSERFLRSIGYYGLVELEYKHDRRDGQTKLLDVNARTWGYHGVSQRAGVDFPYLLYADQLGLPAQGSGVASPGVSWIRLVTDVPTAALELTRGRLGWREYLGTLRSFDVESVFSRDDPLPGLAELALLPYSALRRGF